MQIFIYSSISYRMSMDPQSPLESVRYVDPRTFGHCDYHDHLVSFNEALQERVAGHLAPWMNGDMAHLAVSATGSDARHEKGPASLIELLFFVDDSHSHDQDVTHKLRSFADNTPDAHIWLDGLEIKDVRNDQLYKCIIQNDPTSEITLISPSRIFDARYLCGSEGIFQEAKHKLVGEILGEEGSRIADRVTDSARNHRHVAATGQQRYKGMPKNHYDLESGIAVYDPEKGLYSFKQGPLRAIQFSLVRDQIRALRNGADVSRIIKLPQNTVQKVNALQANDLMAVSPQEVRDLADNYKFFLWQYHKPQIAYTNGGNTEMGFDAREVKERCQAVDALTGRQLLRYSTK
jgi:hypothetical protein